MPSWDSVNVMNTLMLYSTTMNFTEPPVRMSVTSAAAPVSTMPFLITNRSLRRLNCWGNHRSADM